MLFSASFFLATHTHTYGEITISIDPLDRLSPQRISVSNSMFMAPGVSLCTPMSLFNSQHCPSQ